MIIALHASFIDFARNTKICAPHHSNYISSIEEFIGRESLFRGIGCFPKRKYTKDLIPILHIINLLKKEKNSVTIYPEAQYSVAGINERID